jgi:hypothetical protein
MSTHLGASPPDTIAVLLAIKANAGHITLLLFLMTGRLHISGNAIVIAASDEVPLLVATAYFVPINSANFSSNSLVFGPIEAQLVSKQS